MDLALYNLQRLICCKIQPNQVLLANTPVLIECLLHSLKQAAGDIGLYVNANKTEFKWEGAISTLTSKPLKLVDKFTHLGSNTSSTESNVNMCQLKAWTSINRLSIIWKFDLSDKIKRDFFQAMAVSIPLYGYTTQMLPLYGYTTQMLPLYGYTTQMLPLYGYTTQMLPLYGYTTQMLMKCIKKKLDQKYMRCYVWSVFPDMFQVMKSPHKTKLN